MTVNQFNVYTLRTTYFIYLQSMLTSNPISNPSSLLDLVVNAGKSNAQAIKNPTKSILGMGAKEVPWNSTALQPDKNPCSEIGTLIQSVKIQPRSVKNIPPAHKIAISGNSYFIFDVLNLHFDIRRNCLSGLLEGLEPTLILFKTNKSLSKLFLLWHRNTY